MTKRLTNINEVLEDLNIVADELLKRQEALIKEHTDAIASLDWKTMVRSRNEVQRLDRRINSLKSAHKALTPS